MKSASVFLGELTRSSVGAQEKNREKRPHRFIRFVLMIEFLLNLKTNKCFKDIHVSAKNNFSKIAYSLSLQCLATERYIHPNLVNNSECEQDTLYLEQGSQNHTNVYIPFYQFCTYPASTHSLLLL